MLHEFLTAQREEIILRCRTKVAARRAPRATAGEIEHGIPIFLDQLVETLRLRLASSDAMGENATRNGNDLLRMGITVGQVVHGYGDVCQAVTERAVELGFLISSDEFRILNRCLDDSIANAVTEYERQRDQVFADASTERLGVFTHELRNLLGTAMLAFEALRSGSVGVAGSTGTALGRSLDGLRNLVDRSLTEVRLDSGIRNDELILIDRLIEDVEISATIEARARGLELTIPPVEAGIATIADRQILSSVIANLLQNAFKFTKPDSGVSLRVTTTRHHVQIAIQDECGGLAPGTAEVLFQPFEQRDDDRSGLGLGLTICRRGVEAIGGTIKVRDLPGTGCIFTVYLPMKRLDAA